LVLVYVSKNYTTIIRTYIILLFYDICLVVGQKWSGSFGGSASRNHYLHTIVVVLCVLSLFFETQAGLQNPHRAGVVATRGEWRLI
jgi:hypothetical protein